MVARDPAVAQAVIPTETSPLLADRPADDSEHVDDAGVSRVENGADQSTADEQPPAPVKDMGTKAYALLPAIAIGVRDTIYPYLKPALTLSTDFPWRSRPANYRGLLCQNGQ